MAITMINNWHGLYGKNQTFGIRIALVSRPWSLSLSPSLALSLSLFLW